MNTTLNDICQASKQQFDLTSVSDQEYLFDLVNRIKSFAIEDILKLGNNSSSPLSFRIAAKITDSKNYIESGTPAYATYDWGKHFFTEYS